MALRGWRLEALRVVPSTTIHWHCRRREQGRQNLHRMIATGPTLQTRVGLHGRLTCTWMLPHPKQSAWGMGPDRMQEALLTWRADSSRAPDLARHGRGMRTK